MDPLSIATGSASLVVMCVQVSATLYSWIDETRQVDTNVAALCEEILALSRVLDSISKTWKRNPQIANAQTDPDGTLWVSVKASIDDCKATLEKMSLMLDDVQKGGFVGRGFLRRPTKQIKFSLKTKDISVYKQRVQSYNSAMQSALHMINLYAYHNVCGRSSTTNAFLAASYCKATLRKNLLLELCQTLSLRLDGSKGHLPHDRIYRSHVMTGKRMNEFPGIFDYLYARQNLFTLVLVRSLAIGLRYGVEAC